MYSKVGTNGESAGRLSKKPRYNRRYPIPRRRRTTVIDEALSPKDGMRAWGIAVICFANGLAGRAGLIPRNITWASDSVTSGLSFSRALAGAHVHGSVNTGRWPTAVRDITSSSAIAVKNTGTDADEYGSRRALCGWRKRGPRGPTVGGSDGRLAVEEGGGSSLGVLNWIQQLPRTSHTDLVA